MEDDAGIIEHFMGSLVWESVKFKSLFLDDFCSLSMVKTFESFANPY